MRFSPLMLAASLALPTVALADTPAPADHVDVPTLTQAQRAACERLPVDFARSGTRLPLLRAVVGSDGKTHIEHDAIEGDVGSFYQGKVHITKFGLDEASKVSIVYGHPGMEIPPHPAPYRELFIILGGSSVMRLADGTSLTLKPGTLFLSDDPGGPPRGGTAGPCGYVALAVQFKPVTK